MEDDDFEKPKISKRKIVLIFLLLLSFSYLTTTIAANITFNSNNRVEFGQGVYNLKACDSFVSINYESTLINSVSYVKKIYIYGFDVNKCSSRYFRITPKSSSNGDYLYAYGVGPGDKSKVLDLYVNASKQVSLVRNQTLIGDPVISSNTNYGDSYQTISYLNGVYTVIFTEPQLLSANLTGTTFESSSEFFPNQ